LIPPVLTDACSLYSGALKYFSATCRKMEPLFPDVKPFVGKQEDAGVEAWSLIHGEGLSLWAFHILGSRP